MKVAILMGSKSDLPLLEPAQKTLRELGIEFETRVLSAHRTPDRVAAFARAAELNGVGVFICAAGGAAHLAGAVAANTLLPVIGLPLARTPLAGLDALYATVQMPAGVPVATVAVDGGINAALLAGQILATADPALKARLVARRAADAQKAIDADKELG